MKCVTKVKWLGKMAFDAELDDHHFTLDASPQVGGRNKGPRPKGLLLSGLAGCTGMDVISILRKMRIEPDYFNVVVEGDMTEEHPKYYKSMHIIYEFKGDNLPLDKLEKAINLSQDRYCGVSSLLRKGAEITHEVRILE